MSNGPVDHLVSLVGSNPMSTLAAVSTLRPKVLTLVHTRQTEPTAGLLSEHLLRLGLTKSAALLGVEPTEPTDVRDVLEGVQGPWHLDYTGGTKVMSCQARLAFEHRGPLGVLGRDTSAAHYVDDAAGLLRADDGSSQAIDESPYSLPLIAAIHGATLIEREVRPPARNMGGYSFERRILSAAQTWVKSQPGDAPRDVAHGLKVRVGAHRDFELDVTIQLGRRVGVISCYVGGNGPVAKQKLFEVIERGRQIGGDLARVALAVTLDQHRVRQLNDDIGARWLPNRAQIIAVHPDPHNGVNRRLIAEWWGNV